MVKQRKHYLQENLKRKSDNAVQKNYKTSENFRHLIRIIQHYMSLLTSEIIKLVTTDNWYVNIDTQ